MARTVHNCECMRVCVCSDLEFISKVWSYHTIHLSVVFSGSNCIYTIVKLIRFIYRASFIDPRMLYTQELNKTREMGGTKPKIHRKEKFLSDITMLRTYTWTTKIKINIYIPTMSLHKWKFLLILNKVQIVKRCISAMSAELNIS